MLASNVLRSSRSWIQLTGRYQEVHRFSHRVLSLHTCWKDNRCSSGRSFSSSAESLSPELTALLERLELTSHASTLLQNKLLTVEDVLQLSSDDLKEIIPAIGERNRLRNFIADTKEALSPPSPPEPAAAPAAPPPKTPQEKLEWHEIEKPSEQGKFIQAIEIGMPSLPDVQADSPQKLEKWSKQAMAQAEEIRTETGPLDYDYTEKEVELCKKNLQNHKACSPDKIKNEML
eukprot:g13074.t1